MTAVLALDIAVLLIGLVVLGMLGWRLWRQVRELGAAVGEAGERLSAATQALHTSVDPAPRD